MVIKQDSNEKEEKSNEIACLKSIYWSVRLYNAFLIQVTDTEKTLFESTFEMCTFCWASPLIPGLKKKKRQTKPSCHNKNLADARPCSCSFFPRDNVFTKQLTCSSTLGFDHVTLPSRLLRSQKTVGVWWDLKSRLNYNWRRTFN